MLWQAKTHTLACHRGVSTIPLRCAMRAVPEVRPDQPRTARLREPASASVKLRRTQCEHTSSALPCSGHQHLHDDGKSPASSLKAASGRSTERCNRLTTWWTPLAKTADTKRKRGSALTLTSCSPQTESGTSPFQSKLTP